MWDSALLNNLRLVSGRVETRHGLLVPGTSDLPLLSSLSRAGYRPLLEAGVRVFEWNGSMLHAKTAVADGRWARVGSSNLNLASWMNNCELDVAVEDEAFAAQMAAQYEKDLSNATEIVLQGHRPRPLLRVTAVGRRAAGSGRAAASALRLAHTVGAAIADHRVLEPTEGSVLLGAAVGLIGLVVITIVWPRVVAWPLGLVAAWFALSLVAKYITLTRSRDRDSPTPTDEVEEP